MGLICGLVWRGLLGFSFVCVCIAWLFELDVYVVWFA